MRILVCASAAPLPPFDGFRLLLDQLVRGWSGSHEVRVVANWPADRPPLSTPPPELRLVPWREQRRTTAALRAPAAMIRSRPLSDERRVKQLWPTVAEELRGFAPDVVHVTTGRLAGLGRRLHGWPTVLGAVDARHLNVAARAASATGWERLARREQGRRIRRHIADEYHRFGHVTVVTPEDRDALLAIDPRLAVAVVPNGVDTERFRPDPTAARTPDRVVFTGTMSYAPNVVAARVLAEEVFPRLRERRPRAELALVGRQPTAAVSRLADLPGVIVTGEVPAVRPWLVGGRVFVAPMTTSTGIKNKLLEAMACGAPCVVSPLALQGLTARHGREVVVADGPVATAEAVDALLADPARADELGRRARRYVETNHSWARVVEAHVELFEQVRARDARPGSRPPSAAARRTGERP
jgi:polysaccharide biosynthesis protein PslH